MFCALVESCAIRVHVDYQVLYASDSGQPAHESRHGRNSIFTSAWLEVLGAHQGGGSGAVHLQVISDTVVTLVGDKTRGQQKPVQASHLTDGSNHVLVPFVGEEVVCPRVGSGVTCRSVMESGLAKSYNEQVW
jgi:hypothetical protein